jgi:hypothetical protein
VHALFSIYRREVSHAHTAAHAEDVLLVTAADPEPEPELEVVVVVVVVVVVEGGLTGGRPEPSANAIEVVSNKAQTSISFFMCVSPLPGAWCSHKKSRFFRTGNRKKGFLVAKVEQVFSRDSVTLRQGKAYDSKMRTKTEHACF